MVYRQHKKINLIIFEIVIKLNKQVVIFLKAAIKTYVQNEVKHKNGNKVKHKYESFGSYLLEEVAWSFIGVRARSRAFPPFRFVKYFYSEGIKKRRRKYCTYSI